MEEDLPVKSRRKKLKRVLPKSKKVNVKLNSSASVAYYKKVKALNASLNSSRVSQTLRSNNKALAQSLQHVKQELRFALNENARLKMDNQDLTVRLRWLENQKGFAEGQASNDRLRSLKGVLVNISQHLLDAGNCVNDCLELCVLTPRTSQSSRPQSTETFKTTRQAEGEPANMTPLSDLPATASTQLNEEADGQEEKEYPHHQGSSIGKTIAVPDVSMILEQSILDGENELESPKAHMDTVLEEPHGKRKSEVKKGSVIAKLPQRVRNTDSKESSSISFVQPATSKVLKSVTTSVENHGKINKEVNTLSVDDEMSKEKAKTSSDCEKISGGKNALPKASSNSRSRRDTFIVCEGLDFGSVEDITSIELDLVPNSPIKDEGTPAEESNSQVDPEVDHPEKMVPAPEKDTSEKISSSAEPEAYVSSKDRTKCSSRKKAPAKVSKAPAKQHGPPSQKDASFFISNPCALNLVHKRVTGSAEGCLDSDGKEKPKDKPSPASTVDSFVAEIKESNRKSTKVASFISVEDSKGVRKSTERPIVPRRSLDAAHVPESENSEQTIYFDTDMEFTGIFPNNTELLPETQVSSKRSKKREKCKSQAQTVKEKPCVQESSGEHKKGRSRQRPVVGKSDEGEEAEEERSAEDKKLAVALRVNKPGQMVFAASRREEDGSRKAIPAKLQTKSRSKSKKQLEEMAKNLPQKEPESIFDFHDMTPRQIGNEKSTNPQSSEFDQSLNETIPSIAPSLAEIRSRLNVLAKQQKLEDSETSSVKRVEKGVEGEGSKSAPSLLGNAPVYSMPLKGDTSDESLPRARSRSRSRSKPRQEGGEEAGQGAVRSKSRSRSRADRAKETGQDMQREDLQSGAEQGQGDEEATGRTSPEAAPRRSARSRSRGRKSYKEAFEETTSDLSVEVVKKDDGHRSRSRIRKGNSGEDEDYVAPKTEEKVRQRGRSRGRKAVGDDEAVKDAGNKADQPDQQQQARRGRSRSRRRLSDKRDVLQVIDANIADSKLDTGLSPSMALQSSPQRTLTKVGKDSTEDMSASDSDSKVQPMKMITERKRSKSTHRRLYSEADNLHSPFSMSCNLPDQQKDIPSTETDMNKRAPSKHRTRSTGVALKDRGEEQPPVQVDNCASSPASPKEAKEKRKSISETRCDGGEGGLQASPSKRFCLDKDKSTKSSCRGQQESKAGVGDAKPSSSEGVEDRGGTTSEQEAAATTPAHKKRKSSLPMPVSLARGEDKVQNTPSSEDRARSKKGSRIPGAKSAEKNEYQQKFSEMKRKLENLPGSVSDTNRHSKPVKKSRPLILPQASGKTVYSDKKTPKQSKSSEDQSSVKKKSAMPSKREKSHPERLVGKKEGHIFTDNRLSGTPRVSTGNKVDCSNDDNDSCQSDGRRVRRAASSVCYKEPSLHAKLRRGDPHTTFLHKEETLHVYKSPKGPRRDGRSLGRHVLHEITNLSIAEADVD